MAYLLRRSFYFLLWRRARDWQNLDSPHAQGSPALNPPYPIFHHPNQVPLPAAPSTQTEQWVVKLLWWWCKTELQTSCKITGFQHLAWIYCSISLFALDTRQEGHHHQVHFTGVLHLPFQMTESSLLLVTSSFFKFWTCLPQEFSNKDISVSHCEAPTQSHLPAWTGIWAKDYTCLEQWSHATFGNIIRLFSSLLAEPLRFVAYRKGLFNQQRASEVKKH